MPGVARRANPGRLVGAIHHVQHRGVRRQVLHQHGECVIGKALRRGVHDERRAVQRGLELVARGGDAGKAGDELQGARHGSIVHRRTGAAPSFDRGQHRGGGAPCPDDRDSRRSHAAAQQRASDHVEGTDIGVVAHQSSVVVPEGVDRATAPSEGRELVTVRRDPFLVRRRDIAGRILGAQRVEHLGQRRGRHVERLVAQGNSGRVQRRVLEPRGERMRDRMSQQHEPAGPPDHDAPGTCSAASRSNTRRISISSSSAVSR